MEILIFKINFIIFKDIISINRLNLIISLNFWK